MRTTNQKDTGAYKLTCVAMYMCACFEWFDFVGIFCTLLRSNVCASTHFLSVCFCMCCFCCCSVSSVFVVSVLHYCSTVHWVTVMGKGFSLIKYAYLTCIVHIATCSHTYLHTCMCDNWDWGFPSLNMLTLPTYI